LRRRSVWFKNLRWGLGTRRVDIRGKQKISQYLGKVEGEKDMTCHPLEVFHGVHNGQKKEGIGGNRKKGKKERTSSNNRGWELC